MNRYPLSLRDRLRFRYGLPWASALPSWAQTRRALAKALPLVLVLLGYALVSNRQYSEEMAAEAAQQAGDSRPLPQRWPSAFQDLRNTIRQARTNRCSS